MCKFSDVFNIDLDANIESTQIDKDARSLLIILDKRPEGPLDEIKAKIAELYNLNEVSFGVVPVENPKTEVKSSVLYNKYSKNKAPKMVPVSEITSDSGFVAIEGEVFGIDTRNLRGGQVLLRFNIYDGNSSITCKIVDYPKNMVGAEPKAESQVRLYGEAQYDTYLQEAIVSCQYLATLPAVPRRMDNAENKRVELHLHTQMSSMDGVSPVKKMVQQAIAWGHPAVAITDHGVVQAFPDAYDAAKGHEDFKVIFGVECYLVEDDDAERRGKPFHASLLAKNQQGLFNLYKIISSSHLDNFFKRPRVTKSLLAEHREGLIVGSACEQGELFKALMDEKDESVLYEIAKRYDYLEVMPTGNNAFMVREKIVEDVEALRSLNLRILEIGDKVGVPVVATGDVHFLDPEDSIYRTILQSGIGYSDADEQAPLFLHTTDEMLAVFDYFGDRAYEVVVENTRKISEQIERIKPIPDGTFTPEMDDSEGQIKDMCDSRAKAIYGEELPEIVRARMDKELDKIIKYGFSVMYLIAQKLVSKSVLDGYLVGSRGSVGSSLVAFLCGITEVNALPPHYICSNCHYSEFIEDGSIGCGIDLPEKVCSTCGEIMDADGHDIPFETFLGFEGDKEPDIDLNFSGDYQPIAHKYTEELFGDGYVFRAGTIGTLADKTAYGFVKKYLEERNKTVHPAEISRLKNGCVGVKRTTGQHPGGLMILPKGHDIHEFCPVQHPADDKKKNIITTHFDYHSISGRLLKLDVLGHDDPTMIRMLQDLTGVDPLKIPLNDKDTMELFLSTKTLGVTKDDIGSTVGTYGVPEFGTRFVRQMLLDTKPSTFSELVRISGLSHGTNVWINNAQELITSGKATLAQAICTRDDIMTYLIYSGLPSSDAFDIMERVRKGKKLTNQHEEIMRDHKIPEWYIDSCNKIEYMFPKAHAVAYVTMAFRIAWFKVHHPKAFFIAYFSIRASEFDAALMMDRERVKQEIKTLSGNENALKPKDLRTLTTLQIVNEMFARGHKFLPIDLYRSDVSMFLDEEDGIRLPFISMAGLGENVAEEIVRAREEDEFSSIEDLRVRGKVNKTLIEEMRAMGILNGMDESNQLSFF